MKHLVGQTLEAHLQSVRRGEVFAAFYLGGATMDEIAGAQDPPISRERVRQLMNQAKTYGQIDYTVDKRKGNYDRIDVGALMSVIRLSTTMSFQDIENICGKSGRGTIGELGLLPAVQRLFRMRRRIIRSARSNKRKIEILEIIRRAVDDDGRPIGCRRMMADHPYIFTQIFKYFGTLPNARLAAGFSPEDSVDHRSVEYRTHKKQMVAI